MHARAQVDALFRDRPAMAVAKLWGGDRKLSVDDTIVRWAIREFGGEGRGFGVFWSGAITDGSDAEHSMPSSDRRGLIRVHPRHQHGPWKGDAKNFTQLWMQVSYELCNVANATAFARVLKDAENGAIDRETLISKIAELEHSALLRCHTFYRDVFRPWAEGIGLLQEPSDWDSAPPDAFDEWIAHFTDPSGYPFTPYGEYYDTIQRRKTGYETIIIDVSGKF